jgi:hypothetical protein
MDIGKILLFIPDGGKSGSRMKGCQTSSQDGNRVSSLKLPVFYMAV